MEEGEFYGPPWGMGHPMFDKQWFKMHMIQARRGDMRGVILRALMQRPMHGYEIIRHLEESSHGMWRPSPGSIYPTLQLLEEEDLVEGREENGKKIYTLTVAGREAAEKVETDAPWTRHHDFESKKEFRKLIAETMHAFRAIVRSGNPELNAALLEIIRSTRDQVVQLADSAKKGKK